MFYNLVESKVNIDNMSFDYISFGKGNKNLIIIQGLNVRDIKGSGMTIALMYKMFAKDYRVYLFDRRPVIDSAITIWDIAEDIHKAMKELKIEKADLFGVSQGGMISMAMAILYPECINKMVLGVTASRPNETMKRVVGAWVECAKNKDYVTINRDTFTYMYTDKYLKKYKMLLPIVVKMVKLKDFKRFEMLASAILNFDSYDRLNEIKCPVLVLGGALDKITTGEASTEIADKLGCEVFIYDEYGHAAYEEAKDFTKRVYDFLMK